jgi:putative acetyltransferase
MKPATLDVKLLAVDVRDEGQRAQSQHILREYAASLAVDLCFQGFEEELRTIQAHYGAPQGLLLLAHVQGELAACGGFRAAPSTGHDNACEMKRLYVRTAYRRLGLGRRVAHALMGHARHAGYACMLLDTLDDMQAARSLYAALGFDEVAPYYTNPIPGVHYLKADLTKPVV